MMAVHSGIRLYADLTDIGDSKIERRFLEISILWRWFFETRALSIDRKNYVNGVVRRGSNRM